MKKPLENNYLKVFLNNLWSNVQSGLANLGKAIIGRILYISHFCLRHRDKIITGEFALVAVIAFFIIFSSLEMKNLYENSNHENLITSITNQDKIIVKAQNNFNNQASSDKKEADFHIAGNRMLANSDISLTLGGSTLITPETEFNDSMPNTRTEVEKYVIEAGDTIYTIAQKFGINITSILAANNLTLRSANLIRPGQTLSILPIDGLTHKVKSGETLDQIARKYKASINDIVDFNGLADASDILANDILIIPYGSQPSAPPPVVPKPQVVQPRFEKTELVTTSPNYNSWLRNTKCHKFYNGQCTSYVAYKWATDLGKCVAWSGNAKDWLGNARQRGFKIGDDPQKGAVVSLCEAGRGCCGRSSYCWGHVAYVESFNNDTITFTEMNHPTPWRVTQRTINRNDVRILGYIYAE
ncbi:MAG: LysM peptidoglycan-binding domain-containing protein [Patescibacteria group bacterium]|nr:LysM peptidoglycan-binding domain-containing protein [Patescibacteria group bacterium]MDD5164339.1 LysM peptidoglycan-binding domain-containing protein [Patescibacteria group bacterium]MDD5534293.1 LysM peptidoglycan-binding domain-containing protein [Patescibacteria group bacterium]